MITISPSDLSWVRDASALAIAGLLALAVIGLVYYGSKVVTLLGNHIVHRMQEQTDLLRDIRDELRGRGADGATVVCQPLRRLRAQLREKSERN